MSNQTHIHPFEAAGLGKAPFKFVGVESFAANGPDGMRIVDRDFKSGITTMTKPGTSCDYCVTYMINAYWIESADGKRFKVGCECVKKTHKKGDRILTQVEKEARRLKREASNRRADERIAAAIASLRKSEVRKALRAQPHPNKWRADQGDTKLDWAVWMFRNSGRSGALKTARALGC